MTQHFEPPCTLDALTLLLLCPPAPGADQTVRQRVPSRGKQREASARFEQLPSRGYSLMPAAWSSRSELLNARLPRALQRRASGAPPARVPSRGVALLAGRRLVERVLMADSVIKESEKV